MFHAHCITSPTLKQAHDFVTSWTNKEKIQAVDIYDLTELKVGIAEIRSIITFLSRAPFASKQKVVIVSGDTLTPEAQHAFLKTLEEPPQKSSLFILTTSTDFLLPTILSRLSIQTLKEKQDQNTHLLESDALFWKSVIKKTVAEKLKITPELAKDRDQVKEWLTRQIHCLRSFLFSIDNENTDWITQKQCAYILRSLTKTYAYIDQNTHLKLALDHLFISISEVSIK